MNRLQRLNQIYRRRQLSILAEGVLLAVALYLPLAAGLYYLLDSTPTAALALAAPAGAALLGVYLWRRRQSLLQLSYELNGRYPALEHSTDLLLQDSADLGQLGRHQQQRVAQILEKLPLALPNRLPLAAGLLALSLLLGLLIRNLSIGKEAVQATSEREYASKNTQARPTPPLPPSLQKASVRVQAPAYTGRAAWQTTVLDIEAPEGSELSWTLSFREPIASGALLLGDGREFSLRKKHDREYIVSAPLTRSGFYSLFFKSPSGDTLRSDYYQLNALPDRSPVIRLKGLAPYVEFPHQRNKVVSFEVYLEDDFGIADARIVTTVSSGEGESVTFRDDTLALSARFEAGKKQYNLKASLRLDDFRMAPGDELYFHIEARDNRRPGPQTAKTAKYIVAFENPESETAEMAGGLGVDRMPEYFRSQRQIIIDTEKLIAEEKKLSAENFNIRSNNTAIDQKVLRLRYGKFLGEEAVTQIGEGADPRSAVHEEEHEHEHEEGEEHHHHEEEEAAHEEEHEHEHDHEHSTPPGAAAGIPELEPFVHAHDNVEEATFFDAVTTTKLRAALAEMWKAELHLRLGEPKKALPYEYKALKLIKEIQQASRVYVERIGFDPPLIPVAEKRLTGELDKVIGARLEREADQKIPYEKLEGAVRVLENLRRLQRAPQGEERALLQTAGDLLAAKALEQPGAFLIHLQYLREIIDNRVAAGKRESYLNSLIRLCWTLLPQRQQQPLAKPRAGGKLEELFWQELSRPNRK